MDAFARGGRFLLIASAAGLGGVFACDRPPESPAGVSAATRPPAKAPADGGVRSTKPLSLLPPDFRTKYAKLSPTRFVSAGHAAGRFEVEVFANEAARDSFAKHTGSFPVGSVLVKEHWERAADGTKPGPLMAMEKMPPGFDAEHGDWRYVVVAPEGEVLIDGKPDGCVLCHDDAPHDRVFRLSP